MKEKDKIWLSPTGVETLERCPRCFWLQYKKGIKQPEGIVSRLANRFDVIVKKYFDLYRPLGELPPMVEGKLKGKLENPLQEKYFYHYDKNYGYYGKLDDCLVESEELYTPIDFKTSSSDPREKETLSAYQNQLDSYTWLLEENKKKTSGIAHLIYFYPEHTSDLHQGCKVIIHIETLKTNPESAKERFLKAIEILERPMPDSSGECPFCAWYERVSLEIRIKK